MRLTKKVRATIRSLEGGAIVSLRVAVLAVFGLVFSAAPNRADDSFIANIRFDRPLAIHEVRALGQASGADVVVMEGEFTAGSDTFYEFYPPQTARLATPDEEGVIRQLRLDYLSSFLDDFPDELRAAERYAAERDRLLAIERAVKGRDVGPVRFLKATIAAPDLSSIELLRETGTVNLHPTRNLDLGHSARESSSAAGVLPASDG
jgi:hypothetical protein